jgi:hypothetical protein
LTTKDTNPKDSLGIRKAPISTVSAPFITGVGLAMMEGGRKYGRHNYRVAGVRASVYYDAIWRHMSAWFEGQDVDPESGLHHMLKIGACAAVMYDSIYRGNFEDDRPPKVAEDWLAEMNRLAAEMIERHPLSKPAITQKGLNDGTSS